jgi:hypothetical protein
MSQYQISGTSGWIEIRICRDRGPGRRWSTTGQDGAAHREVGGRLEVAPPAQRATEAARVEGEARLDPPRPARLVPDRDRGARRVALEADDLLTEADGRPHPRGALRQQFVELRTHHLERRRRAGRALVGEVDRGVDALPVEVRAVLALEPVRLHVLEQAGLFERDDRVREQALADREAGELRAFEDLDPVALPGEQRRGDRARRPRADDDDVAPRGLHAPPLRDG